MQKLMEADVVDRQSKYSGAVLTIDLDAIRENYRHLCNRAGNAACAAVLKAHAYGLGAARITPVLAAAGCRHFFGNFSRSGFSI